MPGAAAAGPGAGTVVDGSETGGGEGGEDAGVIADGVRGAFVRVTGEAGADQVVGVAGVGPGAGRAARGATVAAGDAEHAARLFIGAVVVQDGFRRRVDGLGATDQTDRVGASSGAADLFLPAVEVGGAGHPQHVAEGGRIQARRGGGVDHANTSWRAVRKAVPIHRV